MTSRENFRTLLAALLASSLVCAPARALVTLNDGHDRIHVSGSLTVSHDSNIFAANGGEGDVVYNSSVGASYARRAGWIGVNASAGMSFGNFTRLKSQNFSDPSFNLELTKQTGRTTGAFTVSAARESRADAAANTRSSSWNYVYGLNFRYNIAGTYDLAGNFGYNEREYVDQANFANLATYSAAFDLFHVFTTERDLILGYRYRYSETSFDSTSTDHGINVGVSGKVFRGVSGSLRGGYQTRIPRGPTSNGGSFQSWTASASLSYAINKKANLNATLSKDFSITATDSSVDVLAATLDAQYAFNSRLSLTGSVGWGDSQFLGESGRLVIDSGPPVVLGPERHDNYLTFSATAGYSFNEHLKIAMTYVWFKNTSNVEFADFIRSSWSLNLSSSW